MKFWRSFLSALRGIRLGKGTGGKPLVVESSEANTVRIVHLTHAIPSPGFGVGVDNPALLFQAESASAALRNIGRISFQWEDAADGTRTSFAVVEVVKKGELVTVAKIFPDGDIRRWEIM